MSSTCFEHPSVHPQEDLYMHLYDISSIYPCKQSGRCLYQLSSMKHILPSGRLLTWMHERNTIKQHVLLFLRMNTWMFQHVEDTIIKFKINVQSLHYVGSYFIGIWQCTVQEIWSLSFSLLYTLNLHSSLPRITQPCTLQTMFCDIPW